jgi:hypothetical protein
MVSKIAKKIVKNIILISFSFAVTLCVFIFQQTIFAEEDTTTNNSEEEQLSDSQSAERGPDGQLPTFTQFFNSVLYEDGPDNPRKMSEIIQSDGAVLKAKTVFCDGTFKPVEDCSSLGDGSGGGATPATNGNVEIDGGVLDFNDSKNIGSGWDYISLNGIFFNSDSSTAGGYIYKKTDNNYYAALFAGNGGHDEFQVTATTRCSTGTTFGICAQLLGDDLIISTKGVNRVEYASIKFATATGAGADTDWIELGANIYRENGYVGIGTSAPNALLHIKTDAGTNAEINIQSGFENPWAIYHDENSEDLRFWNNDVPDDKHALKIENDGDVHAQSLCLDGDCKSNWNNIGGSSYETIAIHSQTDNIPSCPNEWNSLWTGYSFSGASPSDDQNMNADLGGSGSCLEEFRPALLTHCDDGEWCESYRTSHYSLWLGSSAQEFSSTNGIENIKPEVSRCRVCQKPSTAVVVRHSQTTSVPSCPNGMSRLWDGYSLSSINMGSDRSNHQDFASAGSCLQKWRFVPFIECSDEDTCTSYTSGDHSLWLTTQTIDTPKFYDGQLTILNKDLIGRCSVCAY